MNKLHDRYEKIRAALPEGTLLLMRLGDFWEAYGDCAKDAARILMIALTKRNNIPMCGIPHHAKDAYIRQLVEAKKTVGLYEEYPGTKP